MPAVSDTEPDATPRSIAAIAPKSNDAWISSTPSVPIAIPKKPPPPKIATDSVNGLSWVAKEKRNRAGPPVNGRLKPASMPMFESEKIPTSIGGSATARSALIPVGLDRDLRAAVAGEVHEFLELLDELQGAVERDAVDVDVDACSSGRSPP